MNSDNFLPPLPEPSDAPLGSVATAFDWYKHTGKLAATAMWIRPGTTVVRQISASNDAALRGLLNRCTRLMLATLKLTADRKHGEIAAILARCITESAVTGSWLIKNEGKDAFPKYFADALRPQLEICTIVEREVAERGGKPLPIEERMLSFVEKLLTLAGMTTMDVNQTPRLKLPNFRAMLSDLGFDEMAYVMLHRMGSQSVHGSWSDLINHYLTATVSPLHFELRDNDVPAQVPLFVSPALFVNRFIRDYLHYQIEPCPERKSFLNRSRLVERKLVAIAHAERPADFQLPANRDI